MSTPIVFDRARIAQGRARAGAAPSFLHELAADELIERLAAVRRPFAAAAEIGLGGLKPRLQARGITPVWTLDPLRSLKPDIVADEELSPLAPGRVPLIVSNLWLSLVNDLPGALLQLRLALQPDGLFLATLLGGETLIELRQVLLQAELELGGGAAPRVAPFLELATASALMQRAGFALPVSDRALLTVTYADLFALIAELRAAGVTSPLADRPRRPPPRALFARAAALYAERFGEADGRLPVTVELIHVSGWGPAAALAVERGGGDTPRSSRPPEPFA